jgi:hypothetical protein
MKEKIIRGIAIATVSIISAALVAYLKDEKNREELKYFARKYSSEFQRSARKAKTKVQEYRLKS